MTAVIIRGGKINGKRILKAWESFGGWYWFAVDKVEERPGDILWFGFVIGIEPEWGYFSQREIESLAPLAWEIKKWDLPFVSKEVKA